MARLQKVQEQEKLTELTIVELPDPQPLLGHLARCRAILEGHFELVNSRHTETFLRFGALGRDPEALRYIGNALLHNLHESVASTNRVVAPATAAYYLGQHLAKRLGVEAAIFATDERRRPLPRLVAGEIKEGDRILVVSDVVSSGRSVDEMIRLIRDKNAAPAAVAAFGAVSPGRFESARRGWGCPSTHLLKIRWESVPKHACSACRVGDPMVHASELN